jgi:hypothetical protein
MADERDRNLASPEPGRPHEPEPGEHQPAERGAAPAPAPWGVGGDGDPSPEAIPPGASFGDADDYDPGDG